MVCSLFSVTDELSERRDLKQLKNDERNVLKNAREGRNIRTISEYFFSFASLSIFLIDKI